jgi:hypothetical protein
MVVNSKESQSLREHRSLSCCALFIMEGEQNGNTVNDSPHEVTVFSMETNGKSTQNLFLSWVID